MNADESDYPPDVTLKSTQGPNAQSMSYAPYMLMKGQRQSLRDQSHAGRS